MGQSPCSIIMMRVYVRWGHILVNYFLLLVLFPSSSVLLFIEIVEAQSQRSQMVLLIRIDCYLGFVGIFNIPFWLSSPRVVIKIWYVIGAFCRIFWSNCWKIIEWIESLLMWPVKSWDLLIKWFSCWCSFKITWTFVEIIQNIHELSLSISARIRMSNSFSCLLLVHNGCQLIVGVLKSSELL